MQITTEDCKKKQREREEIAKMNYRQWKKKYKKEHEHNPQTNVDKRKQKKAAKKLQKIIQSVDLTKLAKSIGEALQIVEETVTGYVKRVVKQLELSTKELKEILENPICEKPDCNNCPFPQCTQSYVDKCTKEYTEREKKENEKEMQELRENI